MHLICDIETVTIRRTFDNDISKRIRKSERLDTMENLSEYVVNVEKASAMAQRTLDDVAFLHCLGIAVFIGYVLTVLLFFV